MTHYRFLLRVLLCVFAAIAYTRSAAAAVASPYEAGELIVLFDSTAAHDVIEATLTASRANQTNIGVTAFDSIGSVHQLQAIRAMPQADLSEFSRRLYVLVFPDSADVVSLAEAYGELPYVVSAEPNYLLQVIDGGGGSSADDPPAVLVTPSVGGVEPGELLVLLAVDSVAAIEATLQASQTSKSTTGIAALDSIGGIHQLQTITALGDTSGSVFSRRLYIFAFQDGVDIVAISLAYNALPHVASAEPNYIVHTTAVLPERGSPLQSVAMAGNHPNPFNPITNIKFDLRRSQKIQLVIYSLPGQKISKLVVGIREAGTHLFPWDGKDENGRTVASGVYVYQLITESGQMLTEKMLLIP